VDTGAGGLAFIDETFAKKTGLRFTRLRKRISLYGFDDSRLAKLTYYTTLKLVYKDQDGTQRNEQIKALVTPLGSQNMILGLPWLKRNQVNFDWSLKRLIFPLKPQTTIPYTEVQYKPMNDDLDINHDTTINLDCYSISAIAFERLAKDPRYELFAISLQDIEKALITKPRTNPRTKLPREYHDFLDVFSHKEADRLPPHRTYDHAIELRPENKEAHGYGPLYGMSQNELLVLRKYLDENLSKGFIRASKSPVSSPVIFVRKPNGGLRFCVDYRKLNELTIKSRYPIPLIQETLARLSQAKYYTKLDIISAFNRIRVREGDEWLTSFRTRYGQFEYLVTPFGLTNAPATFQHYVNDTLRPFLDQFCTAYIDDILIYSTNLKDHQEHIKKVLAVLRTAGLQIDIDKCEFHQEQVLYLGLFISTNGITMDPAKISAIVDWEEPKTIKDIRSFLGFANFYRRFINEFSQIVTPLVQLTKKGQLFNFDSSCQQAFSTLKKAFTTAPILRHYDPDLPCILEADSSDFAIGGILSQRGLDGDERPVAYFSRKLAPAEGNYEIYDKELLAIIRCLEQWRPELEGALFPIEILSDHKNLQYFATTKQLTARQARWAEYLSRFNFMIKYRPGRLSQKPDALSRRSQDQSAQEATKDARIRPLLDPKVFIKIGSIDRTIQQIIEEEYKDDSFLQSTLDLLRTGGRSKQISLSECEIRNDPYDITKDRLYYKGRLVIPDSDELRFKILQEAHDSPVAGHPGRTKTLALVSRYYYWPKIYDSIQRYIRSCHVCQRAKASREAYQGLLKPLSIPEHRWQDISMDFIQDLPIASGYTNILVVVDRLSKMAHVLPCNDITAPATAKLFLQVWKLHGLPRTITSDRGSQFISTFWQCLIKRLGIKANLSTAFHPETDGQTERVNSIIEQYVRSYTNYQQDDWDDWLPLAEFVYNNATSESTKTSPFFAVYGQHPRLGFEPVDENERQLLRPQRLQAEDANSFADRMSQLIEWLRDNLVWAQEIYTEYANRNRTAAPAYKKNDLVWLSTKYLRTKRPAKKFDWKWIGPYPITKVVSPFAYRLRLPSTIRAYPTFHTSLLRPVTDDPLPGQNPDPPPPVEIDQGLEYAVERIDNARYKRGSKRTSFELLVKWTGYEEPTWEPYEELENTAALEEFEARYPRWKTTIIRGGGLLSRFGSSQ
jgi:transposase InsO family protein